MPIPCLKKMKMRFTAGEDFVFCFHAKGLDFGLGNEIVREDDLGFRSTMSSKSADLLDGGSYPVPFGFREKWSCEIDFHRQTPSYVDQPPNPTLLNRGYGDCLLNSFQYFPCKVRRRNLSSVANDYRSSNSTNTNICDALQ